MSTSARPTKADLAWAVTWAGLAAALNLGTMPREVLPWIEVVTILVGVSLRRLRPLLGATTLLAGLIGHALLAPYLSLGVLIAGIALAYIARRWVGRPWRTVLSAALGVGIIGFILLGNEQMRQSSLGQRLLLLGWGLVIVLVASLAGELRRRGAHDAENRLETLRLELELQREQYERRATEQRTFIAREVHDIVTHTLGTIVAQADGGRYAAASDPQAAVRALTTIGQVGRTSLRQMRGLVGMLRDGEAREPQPLASHEDLPQLLAEVAAAGLAVSSTVQGEPPEELPGDVSLAIYRVAQEGLTNVRRHSGASRAELSIDWQPTTVAVTVTDHDDRSSPTALHQSLGTDQARGGHGLRGLAERVQLLGGSLESGPFGGGWRVRAEIPREGVG